MDIPHWLSTPALIAAITAVVASLVPILLKLVNAWHSRRSDIRLLIKVGDKTVAIEGKSVDAESVQRILKALESSKAAEKGGAGE